MLRDAVTADRDEFATKADLAAPALVTDDREALKARLAAATGACIAALEAVTCNRGRAPASVPGSEAARDLEGKGADSDATGRTPKADKTLESSGVEHQLLL